MRKPLLAALLCSLPELHAYAGPAPGAARRAGPALASSSKSIIKYPLRGAAAAPAEPAAVDAVGPGAFCELLGTYHLPVTQVAPQPPPPPDPPRSRP